MKNKKLIIALIILIIIITGLLFLYTKNKEPKNPGKGFVENELFDDNVFCGSSIYSECETGSDCVIGGCSNQLCGNQGAVDNMMSSCDKRPCYDYARFNLKCGCKENICQWY